MCILIEFWLREVLKLFFLHGLTPWLFPNRLSCLFCNCSMFAARIEQKNEYIVEEVVYVNSCGSHGAGEERAFFLIEWIRFEQWDGLFNHNYDWPWVLWFYIIIASFHLEKRLMGSPDHVVGIKSQLS